VTDHRGFTYSDEHRHQCEVRFVLAMPSRAQRADYLDERLDKKRGAAAAQRLRDDVRAGWLAARGLQPPAPVAEQPGPMCATPVHLEVNGACTPSAPANGSFLAPAAAGNSDPIRSVVSEVRP
jgi:hypothetical protein